MSHPILLRGAKQVLTLRGEAAVRRGASSGELQVIEDGSVFMRDGKIVSVGPTRRLENLREVRGAIDIPAHNCILMPGFIDSLIQLNLAARRPGSLQPRRKKLSEFHHDGLTLMRQCLQHGTLYGVVRAGSGVRSLGADLSVLRQIAKFGNTPVRLTTVWQPHMNEAGLSEKFVNAMSTVARRKLASSIELEATAHLQEEVLAKAIDFGPAGVTLDWRGGELSTLGGFLERCSPTRVACHHALTAGETEVLARSKSIVILRAGSLLLDETPNTSAGRLLEEGGALALGSGYDSLHESNYNMQFVLGLAVRRLGLSIEQAIVATTINAAYALNRGNEIGSLEPGKRADVVMLNLSDYREIPRRLGVNHVAMVFREGSAVINRMRSKPAGAA